MSYAASVGRLMMLTARNSDLNFRINLLSQNLMQLMGVSTRLVSASANLLPNSPQAIALEAQKAQLAQLEKNIQIPLELARAQQRAVQTEIESVQKVVSESVKVFKVFGE